MGYELNLRSFDVRNFTNKASRNRCKIEGAKNYSLNIVSEILTLVATHLETQIRSVIIYL
jgi:hypothetical protein